MKRSRVAALLIAALTLAPFSRAHADAPPALAADNTISSVGSVGMLVTLDQTLTVPLADGRWKTSWMSFETTGTYAGVALQELPRSDGSVRKTLLNVRLMPPVECTTHGVCEPEPFHSTNTNVPWIEGATPPGYASITFEPGTYVLYAFTDPGATMTVHWHLPMPSGEQQFTPSLPIQFQTKATTMAPVGGVGVLAGSHSGHLFGDGLVSGMVWRTSLQHILWAQWSWQCIRHTDDRPDPLGMCGFPIMTKPRDDESGIGMNFLGVGLHAGAGDWSHVFRVVNASPPDGQMGAFTFWFTFLEP